MRITTLNKFKFLLLSLSPLVSSFGLHPAKRVASNPIGTSIQQRIVGSSLHLLIYGWEGEEDEECSTEGMFPGEETAPPSVCSPVGVALAESIQSGQDKVGTLARLAVAFSPPERRIELDAIENVQIMCVSESQIEIEAVLCEDHGCVSLFVPITFPHDCGPSADHDILEQCILDNLHYLDMEADNVISNMVKAKKASSTSEAEQCNELKDLEAQLYSSATVYPSWWVAPDTDYSLVSECENIRRLLAQEEFQGDVMALARKGLEALGLGGEYYVRSAIVTAVGPAGLCLRAISDFSGSLVILDVPLPFGGDPQRDPQGLRAAVLGEVAAANVL